MSLAAILSTQPKSAPIAAEMRIPLLDRYAKAHPAADAPEIELVTLADALTRKFRRDQHFAAYTPSLPHRLSGDSLTTTTAAMQLTVFDVDDPGKVDGHAREEWREAERTKISRLVDLGLFAYLTRGGYRLVGRLDEPITISSTTDAAKWRATYLSWCQYLTRVHQIAADTACQDFSRLFRIPHGTRERGQEPEALPTYGDPENIGTWAPELAPEDIVEPEASRGARAVTPREGEDPGARIAPLGIRVAHALAYAESLPPAVSGQGGHNALLTAASTLYRGLYLPRDVAEQVLETYSERCEPPWKSKDLAHKLDAVEGSSEGWGELIAAILFLEAAEQVCPRPANENAATTDTIASPDVPSAPERPEVVITNSAMRETVDAAIVALAREPNVYRSGNEIVRVVRNIKAPKGINRDTDTPLIKAMPDAAIRETIEANASWIRIVEKNDTIEKRAALPPAWVVEGIVARDTWPQLRALEAVTESPILRSDGTVLDAPGFDPDTGILYVPNAAYPRVPSIPTDQEIASAVAVIRDAICDFKFQTPAHEAGFFAAVLTPFVRTQISAAPLFLFDASTAGSGKGLLSRVAGIISTGRQPSASQFPGREEEREKRITTFLKEGDRLIRFDNVVGTLGGQSLCTLLTEPVWKGRILAKTEGWAGAINCTTYATGNNALLGSDMDRRVVHIRIDPGVERPEDRGGFKYPNLIAHVRQHHPELSTAALTILRGYFAAGRPKMQYEVWGGFEDWCDVVVAALRYAGFVDPFDAREALREVATSDADDLRDLVHGFQAAVEDRGTMHPIHKVRCLAVADLITDGGHRSDRVLDAARALLEIGASEAVTGRKLAALFQRYREKLVGGAMIYLVERDPKRGARWGVRAIGG